MTIAEHKVAAAFAAHGTALPPGFSRLGGIVWYKHVSLTEFLAWHQDTAGLSDVDVAASINWLRPGLPVPLTAEDVGEVLALARRWGLTP